MRYRYKDKKRLRCSFNNSEKPSVNAYPAQTSLENQVPKAKNHQKTTLVDNKKKKPTKL